MHVWNGCVPPVLYGKGHCQEWSWTSEHGKKYPRILHTNTHGYPARWRISPVQGLIRFMRWKGVVSPNMNILGFWAQVITFCSRSRWKRHQMVRSESRFSTTPEYRVRLRDSMGFIKSASEINTLAASVPDTGGVYFVTAFSGLLAPYWDPGAAGLLIGTLNSPPLTYIALI
jgi:hypothetical protein